MGARGAAAANTPRYHPARNGRRRRRRRRRRRGGEGEMRRGWWGAGLRIAFIDLMNHSKKTWWRGLLLWGWTFGACVFVPPKLEGRGLPLCTQILKVMRGTAGQKKRERGKGGRAGWSVRERERRRGRFGDRIELKREKKKNEQHDA
jgi:hypothetical protein